MTHSLIITCEHAGNTVPASYQHLFATHPEALNTHEGWDPGALAIAEKIGEATGAPLFSCRTTRLLIETNRSLGHRQLFSRFSETLPEAEKQRLIETIYHPYREKVTAEVGKLKKPVLHLSVHTFTPVWNGIKRQVDIGLLFDPSRPGETGICGRMAKALQQELPHFKIRFNEPYEGTDDGFTTYLRTHYPSGQYAGIEIEVNQDHITQAAHIGSCIVTATRAALRGA